MTADELRELLDTAHELRRLELKSGGPFNSRTKHSTSIAKAMMGMANTRDGGTIVVGAREADDGTIIVEGVDAADRASWVFDDVMTFINNHAEPSVAFAQEFVELGVADLLVISVHEFTDVPVICHRPHTVNGEVLLPEGALYVRPHRKVGTTPIQAYEDMRELMNLAIEKGLAAYVALGTRAGIRLGAPEAADQNTEAFEAEVADLHDF